MSRMDNVINAFGLNLLGAALFGICYGIKSGNISIFKWGLLIYGVATPFAVYLFIKYKMWKRR